MKVISIVNLKGGVGKTTTAINLAYLMAQSGQRTLIIDNDSQGNVASFFDVKKDKNNPAIVTTADILRYSDEKTIRAAIQESKIKNLSVIAGGEEIEAVNIELSKEKPSERYAKLKNSLHYIADEFDRIIIDNNPNMTSNVINSFLITNDLIVPMEPDLFSIDGLVKVSEQMKNSRAINQNIKLAGVLLTRVNARCKKRNKNIFDNLVEKGYPVFETMIHSSERVKDSIDKQIPLVAFKDAEKIRPARDYIALHAEYESK